MTLLADVIGYGAAASRPAAGMEGRLYYSTDTDILERDNGSTWDELEIGGGASGGIGATQLVYRYTVTGSDKASIDTGADSPDAGDNDWTGGDMLEVYMLLRTDDAAAIALVDVTLNNDSSAIYDHERVQGVSNVVSSAAVLADTRWQLTCHGSGGSATYASAVTIWMPRYAGTTFWKSATIQQGPTDATAANNDTKAGCLGYRSTSAVTRLKVDGQGSANLKVGSQLLIYKRLNA